MGPHRSATRLSPGSAIKSSVSGKTVVPFPLWSSYLFTVGAVLTHFEEEHRFGSALRIPARSRSASESCGSKTLSTDVHVFKAPATTNADLYTTYLKFVFF